MGKMAPPHSQMIPVTSPQIAALGLHGKQWNLPDTVEKCWYEDYDDDDDDYSDNDEAKSQIFEHISLHLFSFFLCSGVSATCPYSHLHLSIVHSHTYF